MITLLITICIGINVYLLTTNTSNKPLLRSLKLITIVAALGLYAYGCNELFKELSTIQPNVEKMINHGEVSK
jgi:hypothetical protein